MKVSKGMKLFELIRENYSLGKREIIREVLERIGNIEIFVDTKYCVVILTNKKLRYVGVAKKNPRDKYNYSIGVAIALWRAITNSLTENIYMG